MGKAVRTFIIFIGVWFISSLLNGIISGIVIMLGENGWSSHNDDVIFFAMLCSFLFSIPFVGLVWFVTMLAQAHGREGHTLFQVILKTSIFSGVIAAIIFIKTFSADLKGISWLGAISIIVSSVSTVLFFRKPLKAA